MANMLVQARGEHGIALLAPNPRKSMPLHIRRAYEADVQAIARAHVACWEETYRGVLPDEAIDRVTLAFRIDQWDQFVRDSSQSIYVAELDGEIVGFASAAKNLDAESSYQAFLDTLYVRARAHRLGVARSLLSAIARAMLERGLQGMELLTLRDRNPACAFYERMGALVVREQPAPAVLGAGIMDRVYAFTDLRVLVTE